MIETEFSKVKIFGSLLRNVPLLLLLISVLNEFDFKKLFQIAIFKSSQELPGAFKKRFFK